MREEYRMQGKKEKCFSFSKISSEISSVNVGFHQKLKDKKILKESIQLNSFFQIEFKMEKND